MGRIDKRLLERLQKKLRLGPSQIYRLIQAKANQLFLPREQAALVLAAESGLNIVKFASREDLQALSQATRGAVSPVPTVSVPERRDNMPDRRRKSPRRSKPAARRGNSVFVVHGRNDSLRRAFFSFLRSVGLNPIEWRQAIRLTRKPSPYVGEILDAAFRKAVAVVVLLTPDDEAKLRPQFQKAGDQEYERRPAGQPRPNVLFEAGMAFGRNPNATVLVQVGDIRPFSDIAGRHTVRLTNSTESRQELILKLANAGCNVRIEGTDWHSEGNFDINEVTEQPNSAMVPWGGGIVAKIRPLMR